MAAVTSSQSPLANALLPTTAIALTTNSVLANPNPTAPINTTFDLSTIDLHLESQFITGPAINHVGDLAGLPTIPTTAPFPSIPAVLLELVASSSPYPAVVRQFIRKLKIASPYAVADICHGLQDLLQQPPLTQALEKLASIPSVQDLWVVLISKINHYH